MRDGFVTYDELRGPDLDASLWDPARLPLPTGEHVPLDPNAEVAVRDGELRVTIPRFSLSHDTFQAADSPKYLVFSTHQFELPPDRPATFAVDLAVENIAGNTVASWPSSSAVATAVRPVKVPSDSSPTAITTRVGAAASASASGR